MTEERWLPVVEVPGYLVSDQGRILSNKYRTPRILRTVTNRDGYIKVTLFHNNVSYCRYLHLVVTAAFIGPRPAGMEVRHYDDDKLNNTLANLSYGTRSENIRDAVRNGTQNQIRKTHCIQGHPYSSENTVRNKEGHRACRICISVKNAKQRAKRKERQVA